MTPNVSGECVGGLVTPAAVLFNRFHYDHIEVILHLPQQNVRVRSAALRNLRQSKSGSGDVARVGTLPGRCVRAKTTQPRARLLGIRLLDTASDLSYTSLPDRA